MKSEDLKLILGPKYVEPSPTATPEVRATTGNQAAPEMMDATNNNQGSHPLLRAMLMASNEELLAETSAASMPEEISIISDLSISTGRSSLTFTLDDGTFDTSDMDPEMQNLMNWAMQQQVATDNDVDSPMANLTSAAKPSGMKEYYPPTSELNDPKFKVPLHSMI